MELTIQKGYTQKDIALLLQKSEGAISYELKTFTRKGRPYDADYAHLRAYQKRRNSTHTGIKIIMNKDLHTLVDMYLKDNQSPEMIEGRIKTHHRNVDPISSRAIRRFIASPYGRKFEIQREKLLKKRRKRTASKSIKDKRMIDKRPKNIGSRRSIGDSEGDFIVSGKSGKGIILNVTDRKCRAVFLEKILPVSIHNVELAFLRIKKRFPELRSLTLDNDLLFIHHKRLENKLNIKIYFCHVHSPWEKGSNENRNKELRKYIRKSSDISKFTKLFIAKVEKIMQSRIMECLNFAKPHEVLERFRKRKKKRM